MAAVRWQRVPSCQVTVSRASVHTAVWHFIAEFCFVSWLRRAGSWTQDEEPISCRRYCSVAVKDTTATVDKATVIKRSHLTRGLLTVSEGQDIMVAGSSHGTGAVPEDFTSCPHAAGRKGRHWAHAQGYTSSHKATQSTPSQTDLLTSS